MKSSKHTNTILNSNVVVTSKPRWLEMSCQLLGYVFTLALFILLIKLGFWQLERSQSKAAYEQSLQQRQFQAPLNFQEVLTQTEPIALMGSNLSVQVTPTSQPLIYLDNQVFEGKVGYLVYQVMSITNKSPQLLVELGFTPAPLDRSNLPKVIPFTNKQTLSGRLYFKQSNPFSERLLPERTSALRIQTLQLPELSHYLDTPLALVALQPTTRSLDANNQPLGKPWQPIPLSSQKHLGYAIQWFSMAAVLTLIVIYRWFKARRISSPSQQQDKEQG
ncbi:SURF1 family protein [Parashewanella tropica]|uniref:SURF1 family protein n=1 Tax=Parashewanella tropica TaxID=2547970 RepID=UPI001FE339D1|nr:SURF1 family protein [Parashewanella tropica]